MAVFRRILTGMLLALAAPVFASSTDGISLTHFEPLAGLRISSAEPDGSQKIRSAGSPKAATMRFDALGQRFELELVPNARLLSDTAREHLPAGVTAYRGSIAGIAGSWSRIVLTNGQPSGLIWDGEELYAVEAPGDSIVASDGPVIYRLSDVVITPGTMSCGTSTLQGSGSKAYAALIDELSVRVARAEGAVSQIDIGAVADFEFMNSKGTSTNDALLNRLNNVDGIFSEQLGIQINIPLIETYDDADDPFTDTHNANALLNELAAYRRDNAGQRNLGLTHLYTGRDLDGSTVGIAFVGALCDSYFGAGLSEGNRSPSFDALIAAHEIGHNFGAPQDGVSGSACESTPANFIMATSLNPNNRTFSQCSINQMSDDVSRAACITPLPAVDMSITTPDSTPDVLLGNSATISFDVDNNGTLEASDVDVEISIPDNVSLLSAASSVGDCSDGAGLVNCSLGNVAGSTMHTVTVTAMTVNVGNAVFDATVSAGDDGYAGNNQQSVRLDIDPAVELTLAGPAASEVTVDRAVSINVSLDNRSILDASNVSIELSLDAGLRADSASWSAGDCNVSATTVDCQAATLAAQSSSTLEFRLTGTAEGEQEFTLSTSATQTDRNPSNNTLNATVTVNATDEDSGGGAFGLWTLGLLGLVGLARRRRD